MSAGFYLGFIVWGRSPEWPKAPSFLGGSFPHPPMESVRFYVEDDENDADVTLTLDLRTFAELAAALDRAQRWREIGLGAQILRDLGVSSIRLLATRTRQYVGLAGFGIEIADTEIIAP